MTPSVWAPLPGRVELDVDGERFPMDRDERGWWHSSHDLCPGTDYAFVLDAGSPLPDPRSRHQPHGVDGPSRAMEPIPIEDRAGVDIDLGAAVLYEMHVGTFTPDGTFDAAIERLSHLMELGVGVVEVMPINQFSGRHGWGYDGVALFAVHDAYGGPDGFLRFVDACHGLGLGVILDVVYNHLGPEGNHLSHFGPYFTDVYQTPWGEAVNLDGRGSDEVRRFLLDNALMWLGEYGVDGLRLDAVHALVDRSAIHFLEELSERVDALEDALGRSMWLIAESDLNDPRLVRERDEGGYGLDASWSDDFHHALHSVLTGETSGYYQDFGTLEDLATALTSVYVYSGRYSVARGRSHGRPVEDLPGSRFVAYLQNHDQIGNRAGGERLGHLVDMSAVLAGATLLLTAPFVPLLFQGEEWAASSPFPYFADHRSPELIEAVREGRRAEFAAFGWDRVPDPQDEATYLGAVLDWGERELGPHAEALDWYRALIRLRRGVADLHDGRVDRLRVTVDETNRTLLMMRGSILVAINFSDDRRHAALPDGPSIDLPPRGVAIASLLR